MVKSLDEYKYSSYRAFVARDEVIAFLKEAIALGYSQYQVAKDAKLTQAMVRLVLKGQK